MKHTSTIITLSLITILGLSACDQHTEANNQNILQNSRPAVTAITDTLEPRYEASLAQGIDFKKPGFPKFLSEISGLSGYETHGRWTEGGPIAKFKFHNFLPSKFTLVIGATAFGPNSGPPVKVRVGAVEKTFIITNKDPNTYRLDFETDGKSNAVEFYPPKPISPSEVLPGNDDKRKLGIDFQFLRIEG